LSKNDPPENQKINNQSIMEIKPSGNNVESENSLSNKQSSTSTYEAQEMLDKHEKQSKNLSIENSNINKSSSRNFDNYNIKKINENEIDLSYYKNPDKNSFANLNKKELEFFRKKTNENKNSKEDYLVSIQSCYINENSQIVPKKGEFANENKFESKNIQDTINFLNPIEKTIDYLNVMNMNTNKNNLSSKVIDKEEIGNKYSKNYDLKSETNENSTKMLNEKSFINNNLFQNFITKQMIRKNIAYNLNTKLNIEGTNVIEKYSNQEIEIPQSLDKICFNKNYEKEFASLLIQNSNLFENLQKNRIQSSLSFNHVETESLNFTNINQNDYSTVIENIKLSKQDYLIQFIDDQKNASQEESLLFIGKKKERAKDEFDLKLSNENYDKNIIEISNQRITRNMAKAKNFDNYILSLRNINISNHTNKILSKEYSNTKIN